MLLRAGGSSSAFIRSVLTTMKYPKTLFVLLLTAAGILSAETAIIELRPAVSGRMELTVEKTGLLSGKKHLFTFSRYRGTLRLDRETPESSSVEFSIEAGTVVCHDTWLSAKDLRKVQQYAVNEMLLAGRHPLIRFQSTSLRKKEGSRYEVEGVLTIRDISKPVLLAASLTSGPGNAVLVEGVARVRLTDFGLKPPTAALGTIGTKDEMTFRFALPANSAAEIVPR